jgi:hypothetical protein
VKQILQPSEVTSVAATIPTDGTRFDTVVRIVERFHAIGHDPWTRKDVDAVLGVMGYDKSENEDVWNIIDGKMEGHPLFAEKLPRRGAGRYGFHETTTPEAPQIPLIETLRPVLPEEPTLTPTEVTVQSAEGTSWVPNRVTPANEGYYGEDMGLRRIAIGESGCYGNWSPKADACGSCPMAGFCSVASMAGIADIAEALNRETEKAIAEALKPPVTTPTPVPTAPTPEPETPSENLGDLPEGAHVIEVPFEGICTQCGSGIPEGSMGVHVPGKGMLHPDCARKVG